MRDLQSGSTSYTTLEGAISAISNGSSGTIKLTSNTTDSSNARIANGKKITLDTQGYTLTKTHYPIYVGNKQGTSTGTLTLKGGGVVQGTSASATSGIIEVTIESWGTLIIGNCTVKNNGAGSGTKTAIQVKGGNTKNSTSAEIVSNLTLNNGAVVQSTVSSSQTGNCIGIWIAGTNCNVTINEGATVKAVNKSSGRAIAIRGIYTDGAQGNVGDYTKTTGTLTIKGGTISADTSSGTGGASGILMTGNSDWGDNKNSLAVNIEGGTISAKTADNSSYAYAPIAMAKNYSTGNLTISGGTISTGTCITSIYFASTGKIAMSGGTVKNTASEGKGIHIAETSAKASTFSGGTITSQSYCVYTKSIANTTFSGTNCTSPLSTAIRGADDYDKKITISAGTIIRT